MYGCRRIIRGTFIFFVLMACASATLKAETTKTSMGSAFELGRPATQDEIQAWNIDISPNGEGLPAGNGTVAEGQSIYQNQCASCHGATGIEGPMPQLVGGQGTLDTDRPLKTIGSYWPFATTLFDYIYRAMPFTAPQSLSPNEVYALVAWILFRNGIIEEPTVVDADMLPNIQMPNRKAFVLDPRPDLTPLHP